MYSMLRSTKIGTTISLPEHRRCPSLHDTSISVEYSSPSGHAGYYITLFWDTLCQRFRTLHAGKDTPCWKGSKNVLQVDGTTGSVLVMLGK